MNVIAQCPECGKPLAANAPEGLCPQCLLGGALRSDGLERTTPVSSPRPGEFIAPTAEELADRFPQFEVLELLGRGGMGAVYKARQLKLDRLVAIKILPAEMASDPSFAERFNREARALARLSHPNIVAVHDFGQSEGLCYVVMEYVDGVNLRQAINERRFTPAEALSVVGQVCDALQYAHEEQVVHRDIKPENILLDKRGRVKIADFGLAKLIAHDSVDVQLTQTRQVIGTMKYMAPEQLEGSRHVDHRADLYSLGVVFYELLTGELPMGRYRLPSEAVNVDARLDNVVLRALERQPEARYQQASEIKSDVDSIRSTVAPLPEKDLAGKFAWQTTVEPSPVPPRSKFSLEAMLAGLGVAGLVGTISFAVIVAATLRANQSINPGVFLLMGGLSLLLLLAAGVVAIARSAPSGSAAAIRLAAAIGLLALFGLIAMVGLSAMGSGVGFLEVLTLVFALGVIGAAVALTYSVQRGLAGGVIAAVVVGFAVFFAICLGVPALAAFFYRLRATTSYETVTTAPFVEKAPSEDSLVNAAARGDLSKIATEDVNRKDHNGVTPLIAAASNGHQKVVEFLLSHGAMVDDRNHFGQTALMLAAYHGHLAVANELLTRQADVNARDQYGATALDLAVERDHTAVIQLLLKGNAEKTASYLVAEAHRQMLTENYTEARDLLLQALTSSKSRGGEWRYQVVDWRYTLHHPKLYLHTLALQCAQKLADREGAQKHFDFIKEAKKERFISLFSAHWLSPRARHTSEDDPYDYIHDRYDITDETIAELEKDLMTPIPLHRARKKVASDYFDNGNVARTSETTGQGTVRGLVGWR